MKTKDDTDDDWSEGMIAAGKALKRLDEALIARDTRAALVASCDLWCAHSAVAVWMAKQLRTNSE